MTIKNIKSINTLSTREMSDVKGGATWSAIISAGVAAYDPTATTTQNITAITTAVVAVVADDKRPPRPGGGITTL
jgi:hypothetical protein